MKTIGWMSGVFAVCVVIISSLAFSGVLQGHGIVIAMLLGAVGAICFAQLMLCIGLRMTGGDDDSFLVIGIDSAHDRVCIHPRLYSLACLILGAGALAMWKLMDILSAHKI